MLRPAGGGGSWLRFGHSQWPCVQGTSVHHRLYVTVLRLQKHLLKCRDWVPSQQAGWQQRVRVPNEPWKAVPVRPLLTRWVCHTCCCTAVLQCFLPQMSSHAEGKESVWVRARSHLLSTLFSSDNLFPKTEMHVSSQRVSPSCLQEKKIHLS